MRHACVCYRFMARLCETWWRSAGHDVLDHTGDIGQPFSILCPRHMSRVACAVPAHGARRASSPVSLSAESAGWGRVVLRLARQPIQRYGWVVWCGVRRLRCARLAHVHVHAHVRMCTTPGVENSQGRLRSIALLVAFVDLSLVLLSLCVLPSLCCSC